MYNLQLQQFCFNDNCIKLFIPNALEVQNEYNKQKQQNSNTHFPFWAKLWPSAMAMCMFLQKNMQYIHQKNILELAAGLGLPSIFCAKYANKVVCSDYVQQPLNIVQASITENDFKNVHTKIINWKNVTKCDLANTILLSDVNYEPTSFNDLLNAIQFFLKNNSTIIITTPQRLMGKDFINKILPFCKHTEIITTKNVDISVFVLQ